MRPADVLAHRRILRDLATEVLRSADDTIAGMAEDERDTAEGFTEVFGEIRDITSDCENYLVTTDMTAVARSAAKTMPSQLLRRDDLPSNSGFMLYASPVGTIDRPERSPVPVMGFMWALEGPYPTWDIRPDDDDEDRPPTGEYQGVTIYPLTPNGRGALIPDAEIGYVLRWEIGDEPVNDDHDLASSLLATWTLMQQSLTVSERAPIDRAERRRSARAGLPSDLLVVRLRRKSLDSPPAEESTDVHWSHRWLVSGHWRNQWLPSRECHRLQWINGYVKGPDSAPLVVKDRVTAWVRLPRRRVDATLSARAGWVSGGRGHARPVRRDQRRHRAKGAAGRVRGYRAAWQVLDGGPDGRSGWAGHSPPLRLHRRGPRTTGVHGDATLTQPAGHRARRGPRSPSRPAPRRRAGHRLPR